MSYARMRYGIVRLRQTMTALRMGSTPIEITEAGMTTAWVPEVVRATAIGKLARTLPTDRKLNVTRFIPGDHERRRHADPHRQRLPRGYLRTIEKPARRVAPDGSSDCRR
jgi:hypothetical protein